MNLMRLKHRLRPFEKLQQALGDKMTDQQISLGRLTEAIERLLAGFTAIQKDKNILAVSLLEKDEEIKQLQAEIKSLREEKLQISQRVDGLIASIEDWEKAADSATEIASSLENIKKTDVNAEDRAARLLSVSG